MNKNINYIFIYLRIFRCFSSVVKYDTTTQNRIHDRTQFNELSFLDIFIKNQNGQIIMEYKHTNNKNISISRVI